MFKSFAAGMIAAMANCTEIQQATDAAFLTNFYGQLAKDEPFFTPQGNSLSADLEGVKGCLTCTAMVTAADSFIQLEKTKTMSISLATKVCITFKLAMQPETVCPDMIGMMVTSVFEVLSSDLISKNRVCNEFLGYCNNPKFTEISVEDYTTRVLSDKPESIKDDNFINNLYDQMKADTKPRKTLKVVHMSDPHIDMEYKVGANNDCGGYLCCRTVNGFPTDVTKQAGKWGAYQCDLPEITLQDMLEHVRDVVKPDLMFWTGDNSPHDTYMNTSEQVSDYTLKITEMIKDTFKDSPIAVYPIQGNHDTWPVNVENFETPNSNANINAFKDSWVDWIGQDAVDKFAEYGYFVTDFKLPNGELVAPGARVIGLNTQAMNTQNWWVFGMREDPGNHMQWLEDELSAIEKAGGVAYLIGHIQPFNYQRQSGGRFRALMERYQHIVRMQFYGHTHDQYYSVTNSITNPDKHIHVSQIGPSVTTSNDKNPAYGYLEMDSEFLVPLNYEMYAMNITEANINDKPDWSSNYINYVKDYKLTDYVSPNEMHALAERVGNDTNLAQLFNWDMPRKKGNLDEYKTTAKAAKELGCMLGTSETFEANACNGISDTDWKKDPSQVLLDWVVGNWITTN